MSRSAKRAPAVKDGEAEGARREFIRAVSALSLEDVAHRIEHDEGTDEARHEPRRNKALPILETLDLHRLTGKQAIARLQTAFQRLAGKQGLVCVIVGKGSHSPDGVAVLRGIVPQWMGSAGRAYVAQWHWAKPHQGGQGALIVRLRRPKP
jgi:DNA-nicking Smr family endonuclease